MTQLKRTPLFDVHVKANARMVGFSGWEMPVQYQSALDEHHATRQAAGLFDVSHMGEVFFEGPNALESLQRLVTNDLTKCADFQAQYSGLLNEQGGFVDDVVVYRYSAEKLLVCVNAGNRDKDAAWLKKHGTREGCEVIDRSDDFGQLAVQGPKALSILQPLTKTDLSSVATYCFVEGQVAGVDCIIARTGYTGEDGFELFCPAGQAVALWEAIVEAGKPHGLSPAGLGARDSLRLEASLRLYGNDMNEERTPLEAGLGWIVKFDKGDFIGRDALVAQKEQGLTRRLVAFKLTGKGIARHDYPVVADGKQIGQVTSGTMGPTVKEAIGFAYLPPELAAVGSTFDIEIRGRPTPAVVVKPPFYKRA